MLITLFLDINYMQNFNFGHFRILFRHYNFKTNYIISAFVSIFIFKMLLTLTDYDGIFFFDK